MPSFYAAFDAVFTCRIPAKDLFHPALKVSEGQIRVENPEDEELPIGPIDLHEKMPKFCRAMKRHGIQIILARVLSRRRNVALLDGDYSYNYCHHIVTVCEGAGLIERVGIISWIQPPSTRATTPPAIVTRETLVPTESCYFFEEWKAQRDLFFEMESLVGKMDSMMEKMDRKDEKIDALIQSVERSQKALVESNSRMNEYVAEIVAESNRRNDTIIAALDKLNATMTPHSQ